MENLLSVVVPCYNEGKIIAQTAAEIVRHASTAGMPFEVIFVDDGSSDETLPELVRICDADKRLKYLSLSRNFGKESAMLAGLAHTTGECVIIMDADLQHPPELIGQMVEKYREGFDQVIACRNRKGDSAVSRFNAKLYYKLVNKLVDVKMVDGAGDFRLLSRRAVDSLLALKENNRFSKGLFAWIGYPQTYIYYENRERIGGETKWSLKRLLTYGIDGILSFNNRPLRICIWLGLTLVGLSILYLLYLLISILIIGVDTPGYFTTILVITCLGGTQLLSIGIIGEYIGRIYYEVKGRPNYFIKQTNMDKDKEDK